jgi:hypothetical protein
VLPLLVLGFGMVLAPAAGVLEEPLAALGDPDHEVVAVRPDGADLLRGRVEERTAVLRVLKLPQQLDAVLKGAIALVERVQGLKSAVVVWRPKRCAASTIKRSAGCRMTRPVPRGVLCR